LRRDALLRRRDQHDLRKNFADNFREGPSKREPGSRAPPPEAPAARVLASALPLFGSGCRNPVQNPPLKYGYARISTDGQSIDAQVRELKAAGARQVFREVASGAKTDRALRRVLAQLDAGDVLIVTRLDRLARSTRDLLTSWRRSPRRKPASDRSATLGRHHDIARPPDADRARRPCRVRARPDPRAHQRRPGARRGERR
jgi:hypothetical protein